MSTAKVQPAFYVGFMADGSELQIMAAQRMGLFNATPYDEIVFNGSHLVLHLDRTQTVQLRDALSQMIEPQTMEGSSPQQSEGEPAAGGPQSADRVPHPEAFCQRCGRPNIVWFAPNEIWNRVNPAEGILCPVCFVLSAEDAGIRPTGWMLAPREYAQSELYEALEGVLRIAESAPQSARSGDEEWIDKARAALAKARGETR